MADEPKQEVDEVKVEETVEIVKPVAQLRRRSAVERATEDIKNEIVNDVVIPKAKDYIYDIGQGLLGILSDILGTALFGEGARAREHISRDRHGNSRVNYSSISWRERYRGKTPPPWETRSTVGGRRRFNLDDVEFPTRNDAETVLNDLYQDTMDYGCASVDAFYTHPLVRISSDDVMDRKMGWEDLSDAKVRASGTGGYFIEFPRPHRIDLES